jgi:2,3-bisphosphoglycerate-independent phosphoglycerate mutase
MKYAILVGDGMADRPVEDLGGRTPLQAAETPWMDTMAAQGILGLVRTVPEGFSPGSDIANLVILGYDPRLHYTGRGPLEAASLGVELEQGDVAFRCNLVHLSLEEPNPRMVDFTAGHISTEKARCLLQALQQAMGGAEIRFYPGVSYRHLMVWKNGPTRLRTVPPHDITGQEIESYLPQGEGAEKLIHWMRSSQRTLAAPEIQAMMGEGAPFPPNSIWPWGQGGAPSLEPITGRLGIKAAMITAVDLLKGLGRYAGFRILDVPGATGYLDTDYRAKGRSALQALTQGDDLVFVHVEAPDEAGHQGSLEEKIRAIERFDAEVVGQVLQGIRQWEEWAVLVLPDHATPLCLRTHSSEPVPFAMLSSRGERGGGDRFEEEAARQGSLVLDGKEILERLVKGRWS